MVILLRPTNKVFKWEYISQISKWQKLFIPI